MQTVSKVMEVEVDPVKVLKADMAEIDIAVQLEAIKNIPTVALAIGPEKSRDELISAVESACFPDLNEGHALETIDGKLGMSEEVLMEVAFVMDRSMIPLLGGQENILPMIKLQQRLAMFDETIVREAAIDSIIGIAEVVDIQCIEQEILAVITHLAKATRWAARSAAANATPRLYHFLESEESKQACRNTVKKLANDKMEMVRYEACCKVHQMLLPMGEHDVVEVFNFISPILKSLTCEQQEDFRCHAIKIVKVLLRIESVKLLDISQEYLRYMFCDINWRIRIRLLKEMMEIVSVAPAQLINDCLLPEYVKCFQDQEMLVKIEAIKHAPAFFAHERLILRKVKVLMTQKIMMDLVENENVKVREASSGALPDILKVIFGVETTSDEKDFVVHIMDKFSSDESAEVRVSFLKGLPKILSCLGEKYFVDLIVPLVTKLLEDEKWRVRSSIFQNITLFARMTKTGSMDEKDLSKILEICLKDPVGEARRLCFGNMAELLKILEPNWIVEKMLNVFRDELANEKTKYHFRIGAIRVAEALAICAVTEDLPDIKEVIDRAVEMMIQGLGDKVSNVRLSSADALVKFIKVGGSSSVSSGVIESALRDRVYDEDEDIKRLVVEGLSLL